MAYHKYNKKEQGKGNPSYPRKGGKRTPPIVQKKEPKQKMITKSTVMSEYGWTQRLIEKFLPPPKKRKNLEHPGGPDMNLWPEDLVKSVMNTAEFQKEFQKILKQRKKQKDKQQQKVEAAKSLLLANDLPHMIEKAKRLNRRFVLHCGPTNSGKTYQAMQALKKAGTGVYLGPLRLLALEVFDTLNSEGIPCNLLTGEESEQIPNASITSSTIEMMDASASYDVAVIDEAQLVADEERGGAWTKAILSVKAKEVHICFAPEVLEFMTALMQDINAPYDVMLHDRLTPLVYSGNVDGLDCVQPGDAFICFSRKSVLNIAASLERDYGVKASVIYGALPPASRREEVRKFERGETSVVVATDAIGMGISLPIKRVIFCETSKFDGTERRMLYTSEIKQIAGRAGRYGKFDKGEVLVMGDSSIVKRKLKQPAAAIRKIVVPFPSDVVESGYSLRFLLDVWQSLPQTESIVYEDMSTPRILLGRIDDISRKMTPMQIYECIRCPVDTNNEALLYYWVMCCHAYAEGKSIPYPFAETNTLEGCELRYKQLDIMHQMLRRCGIEMDTSNERDQLCRKINEFLTSGKDGYIRKCRRCHKRLPLGFPYGICSECYEKSHWHDDFDWL